MLWCMLLFDVFEPTNIIFCIKRTFFANKIGFLRNKNETELSLYFFQRIYINSIKNESCPSILQGSAPSCNLVMSSVVELDI